MMTWIVTVACGIVTWMACVTDAATFPPYPRLAATAHTRPMLRSHVSKASACPLHSMECFLREAPCTAAIELVAYQGCDKWANEYGLSSEEMAEACPANSLTFTGHVGLRFKNGCSCTGGGGEGVVHVIPGHIYGFAPIFYTPDPPVQRLILKESFPGRVADDSMAFFAADGYSWHGLRPVTVLRYPYRRINATVAREKCYLLCADLVQSSKKEGVRGKRYAFPYANGVTPSAWWINQTVTEQLNNLSLQETINKNRQSACAGGYGTPRAAATHTASSCYNCATYPASLDINIPQFPGCLRDRAGEVEFFVRAWRNLWQSFRQGVWSPQSIHAAVDGDVTGDDVHDRPCHPFINAP